METFENIHYNFENRLILIKSLKKKLTLSEYFVFLIIFNKFYNTRNSRLFLADLFEYGNCDYELRPDNVELFINKIITHNNKITKLCYLKYKSLLLNYFGYRLFRFFDDFKPVEFDGQFICKYLNIHKSTFTKAIYKLSDLNVIRLDNLDENTLKCKTKLNENIIYDYMSMDEKEVLESELKQDQKLSNGHLVMDLPIISSMFKDNELSFSDFLVFAQIINSVYMFMIEYEPQGYDDCVFDIAFDQDIDFKENLLIKRRQVSSSIANLFMMGLIDKHYFRKEDRLKGRQIWLNSKNTKRLIKYFEEESVI